ncbi:Transmembrane protein 80 [Anabarilius grahami]|uniref:Transmembrane protein 80 n=1 Tax=Anabarilius grahami TaxID=495550 RepID=A0A3N0XKG9_ANAGA|nr:Transmembrane protein 80 [Anabarilius grahami]
MIIYKTHVLSYPVGRLALDMCLLFLMAGFEVLRVYWGVRGNLQESEGYTGSNLIATGATVLLALYFVIWQSYVLRADVIIGAILLCLYGLTGIVGLGTLARFTRFAFTGWMDTQSSDTRVDEMGSSDMRTSGAAMT